MGNGRTVTPEGDAEGAKNGTVAGVVARTAEAEDALERAMEPAAPEGESTVHACMVGTAEADDVAPEGVDGRSMGGQPVTGTKAGAARAAELPAEAETEGATDRDEELLMSAAPEGASKAGRPAEAGKTAPEGADGVATDELSTTGTNAGADSAVETRAEAERSARPEGVPRSP